MPCCLQRNSQTRGREHRLWGAVTPTTLRLSARSVMGGIGPSMSLCRNALSRLTLDLEHFGTLQPTFGHLRPGRPARRIAGELCHLLTVGGVSQEFLGRIHWAFSWLRAGRAFNRCADCGQARSRAVDDLPWRSRRPHTDPARPTGGGPAFNPEMAKMFPEPGIFSPARRRLSPFGRE